MVYYSVTKYNVIYLFILPFVTIWMDLVEKEMATHSNILAWKISQTEKTGRPQSIVLQKFGYDWATEYECTGRLGGYYGK